MSTPSNSGVRLLRVISALKGHSISGLTNGDLAKTLNIPAPTITRLLETLVSEGFAMRLDSGRYALSVKMLQIAQTHANEISRAQDRINELNQRVHAGAHR